MSDELKKLNDDFNKNYNISYVDENLPVPTNKDILKHYICSLFVYGIGLLLLIFNPFYNGLTQKIGNIGLTNIAITMYLIYLFIAPIFLFTLKPKTVYISHNVDVVLYILKILNIKKNEKTSDILNRITPDYRQSQALMLFFIKFFFGPQLICWTIEHIQNISTNYKNFIDVNSFLQSQAKNHGNYVFAENLARYRGVIYGLLIQVLYFIDCIIFSIGYCTELVIFKNRIRTVDTSFFGIFVCLMCYPPFNAASSQFIEWQHNESNFEVITTNANSIIVWALYILSLFLLFIYTSASIALFTKASNLTNRGTVKIFPYNIIRHPAYVSKVLLWWIGSIAIISELIDFNGFGSVILYICSALMWTLIYVLRAITEERHLLKDPEYKQYMEKVKYRFIPYVW